MPRIIRPTKRSTTPISSIRARRKLSADFWDRHGQQMHSLAGTGQHFYRVQGPLIQDWQAESLRLSNRTETVSKAIVRSNWRRRCGMQLARDYRGERHNVWGITARNREQNFALNLLMNPDIDFITILGPAGTARPC